MRIDIAYPAPSLWHNTWNTCRGWFHGMQRLGLLHQTFCLDETNATDFLRHLSALQSDLLLVFYPNHFMPFLHDSPESQACWATLKIPAICFCGDAILHAAAPDVLIHSQQALSCYDYFIYWDERDRPFFQGKRASLIPCWVDIHRFRHLKPFQQRYPRLFFTSQATNVALDQVDAQQHAFLQQLQTRDWLDYLPEPVPTSEDPQPLVNFYNQYQFTIQPPGAGPFNQHLYQAMACGAVVLHPPLQDQPLLSALFREYIHYIPYNGENLVGLGDTLQYCQGHPAEMQVMTQKAMEAVRLDHSIEARWGQILRFINTGVTVEEQLLPEPLARLYPLSPPSIETDRGGQLPAPITAESLPARPLIVLDAVFYQLFQTGIGRVWRSLLEAWQKNGFARHLLILDRIGTAPKISGYWYREIGFYDYHDRSTDQQMLQDICDEVGADLFISTYYTTPLSTPSVFMAYDMIPEIMGGNLREPMWAQKHLALKQAIAHLAISHNTARDLTDFFPQIDLKSVVVAHCGVDPLFSPAADEDIQAFRQHYGIRQPYFLIVGGGGSYKNSLLFFRALAQLPSRFGFEVVCTGSQALAETSFRDYTAGITVHFLRLKDHELRLAYAGAIALVYPSRYEGFGLPVLEAMASGCPVITCANASLPEVGGTAVLYVEDHDPSGLAAALCEVQKPLVRQRLIQAGLQQAQKFSWQSMADIVQQTLIEATLHPLHLRTTNWVIFPDWAQPEEVLLREIGAVLQELAKRADHSQITLLLGTPSLPVEEAHLLLSGLTMHLMMTGELDPNAELLLVPTGPLAPIQWAALLPHIHRRVILPHEDQTILRAIGADRLPSDRLEKLA